MLCDYAIERYIRKNFYDDLKSLSPIIRSAEKFRLETEALKLKIEKDDEIIGWLYFDNNSENALFADEMQSESSKRITDAPDLFGCRTNVDRAHIVIDYESVLKNGLVFYEKQIDGELKKYPQDEYLAAMKRSVDSVLNLMKRISVITEKRLFSCDESQKSQLISLKQMIDKVPYYPAESFCEAVQAVWILHFLIPLSENAWYSISLGKFDEYMYPYYKASVLNGMTEDKAKSILRNFYKLLNSYCDGACLLNVGPKYNELSELIIECQKEFEMPAPILGARVDENTSGKIWDLLIDEKLFSSGQPTFYGEKSCINALMEKGVPQGDIEKFSNNSCMGIGIPGNEFNSMWGCVLSVSNILEAAVNCGKILKSDNIIVPSIDEPRSIEGLFENFEKCAEYMLEICVKSYEERAELSKRTQPNPFVSLLTPGCIEKRCDRISGAKYHNVTFECMGMINASDGICAVDELVFKKKLYSISEINEAVKNNFVNFENIRNDIMKCSKFGENSAADVYAVRVAEILSKLIRKFSHGNIYYCPSLHTIDANVAYGAAHGAGYDGRYAGKPFAKNAGASNEARKSNPTSMILSASKLPQHKFFGGQPIDVNFGIDAVRNHKAEIKTLINIYLERGGLQFQVNSLSSKLLKSATENPESYPNLIVRIGGYSDYFKKLPQKTKKEFIERLEYEEI